MSFALVVGVWALLAVVVAGLLLALPWSQDARAQKPLGCSFCMAGWGVLLVPFVLGCARDVTFLGATALLAGCFWGVVQFRGASRAALLVGALALLAATLNYQRALLAPLGLTFQTALLAWGASWGLSAVLVRVAFPFEPPPPDLSGLGSPEVLSSSGSGSGSE